MKLQKEKKKQITISVLNRFYMYSLLQIHRKTTYLHRLKNFLFAFFSKLQYCSRWLTFIR